MELTAIRHSKVVHVGGRCYGDLEVDICERSLHQASLELRKQLPLSHHHVFSSPSLRCQKLANIIDPHTAFCIANELKEMNFGLWEGVIWEKIPRSELDSWAQDIYCYTPPQGEAFQDVCNRVIKFIDQHIHLRSCTIITHAGVIKALYCILNQDPDAPYKKIEFAGSRRWSIEPRHFAFLKAQWQSLSADRSDRSGQSAGNR